MGVVSSPKLVARPAVAAGAKTEVIAGEFSAGLGIGADVRQGEAMTLPIDAIYFLLFPGWRKEVEYFPWHYGRRWARRVPVVLVQPELAAGAPVASEPERRLDNVEILSVEEQTYPGCLPVGVVQARQIVEFMRRRGHRRPLLWFHNPSLVFAYALVPAVARIYFGDENFLELTDEPDFVAMARAALAISDKIICGSDAMLERVRAETGRIDLSFIPNGCDYERYANPKPVEGGWTGLLQPVLATGTPIAVCAGSINNRRYDFDFLNRLAERLQELHFVYAGPVELEKDGGRESWTALIRRRNVTYLGFVEPADLPWLYRLSDRGFIPYRLLPMQVKNPIPLKSLEMAAAGLPVVSMLMESLFAISEAVEVAPDEDAFVEKLRRASRKTRSPEAAARADALCREYDYDLLFDRALRATREADLGAPPRPAPLAPIYAILGAERALRDFTPPPEPAAASAASNPGDLGDFHGRAAPPPGLSFGRRVLWRLRRQLAALVPEFVKSGVKRITLPPPPDLPWQRRLLWRVPPAAGNILPNSLKLAIKRSLKL